MNNYHVAMITPWNKRGGIADYSTKLCECVQECGLKVTNVEIDAEKTANPWKFVRILKKIPSSADVIHTQFEAGVFGKFGMTGIAAPLYFSRLSGDPRPIVTTLHEVHRSHPQRGTLGDLILQARDTIIERMALEVSERVIVHTDDAATILNKRHGDTGNIDRLRHPVQTDAEPMNKSVAKQQLGFDEPLLLTFGWIEQKKTYQDVFEAMQSIPDMKYLIAGEPRTHAGELYLDEIKQLASELGVEERVEFYGYVPEEDISTVFSAADITVLPYNRVSQSGVINRALSYQRPVIATALPAFTELQRAYDCLKTYDNEEELVEKIKLILSDSAERDRLQAAAREYTQTETWDRFAEHTTKIYEAVIDQQKLYKAD